MTQCALLQALLNDFDWFEVMLAQCRLNAEVETLHIEIPPRLWDPIVNNIGLINPHRIEVNRVSLWRDGKLLLSLPASWWRD